MPPSQNTSQKTPPGAPLAPNSLGFLEGDRLWEETNSAPALLFPPPREELLRALPGSWHSHSSAHTVDSPLSSFREMPFCCDCGSCCGPRMSLAAVMWPHEGDLWPIPVPSVPGPQQHVTGTCASGRTGGSCRLGAVVSSQQRRSHLSWKKFKAIPPFELLGPFLSKVLQGTRHEVACAAAPLCFLSLSLFTPLCLRNSSKCGSLEFQEVDKPIA